MKKMTFDFNPEWLVPLQVISRSSRWRIIEAATHLQPKTEELEQPNTTEKNTGGSWIDNFPSCGLFTAMT